MVFLALFSPCFNISVSEENNISVSEENFLSGPNQAMS